MPVPTAPVTAWDRLLDLMEQLSGDPRLPLTTDVDRTFAALCAQAVEEGSMDRELDPDDSARWIVGLIAAHHAVRHAHPEVDPDHDLSALKVITTRWLHPARPR